MLEISDDDAATNLVNEFTWSKSRDKVFNTCLRMYYLNYYAYWGGWNKSASRKQQDLYTMKNLSTRPLLLGKRVHETIEWVIRRLMVYKSPVNIQDALWKTHCDLLTDWLSSMKHHYFTWPKETQGLAEHYYGQELGIDLFKEDCLHAEDCVSNLYDTKIYQMLLREPLTQVSIESRDSMLISDVYVWVQLDLIARFPSGNVEIIDWKTGRETESEDIKSQLAIYALYAKGRWETPTNSISVRIVNLLSGEEILLPVDINEMEEIQEYIRCSILKMKKMLEDPENNIALPEAYFPMTENTKTCNTCNFRGYCHGFEHVVPELLTPSVHIPVFEQEFKGLKHLSPNF
jgi:hypothetical protein